MIFLVELIDLFSLDDAYLSLVYSMCTMPFLHFSNKKLIIKKLSTIVVDYIHVVYLNIMFCLIVAFIYIPCRLYVIIIVQRKGKHWLNLLAT